MSSHLLKNFTYIIYVILVFILNTMLKLTGFALPSHLHKVSADVLYSNPQKGQSKNIGIFICKYVLYKESSKKKIHSQGKCPLRPLAPQGSTDKRTKMGNATRNSFDGEPDFRIDIEKTQLLFCSCFVCYVLFF